MDGTINNSQLSCGSLEIDSTRDIIETETTFFLFTTLLLTHQSKCNYQTVTQTVVHTEISALYKKIDPVLCFNPTAH